MKKLVITLISSFMLVSLAGCQKTSKRNVISPINVSFLKDFKADIEDAQSIGISTAHGKTVFIKQDNNGTIRPVTYSKKASNEHEGLYRERQSETINQDELDVFLLEYKTLSDVTLLKYAKNIKEKEIYLLGDNYGVYLPSISKANHYHSYKSGEDDFYPIIRKVNDKYEIYKDGLFYSNDVFQSFIMDNKTGYLYKIDFYSTDLISTDGSPIDGERYGYDCLGFLGVVNNKITLTKHEYILSDDSFESVRSRTTDLSIKVVDDNLYLTELGLITDARDKYGQFYVRGYYDIEAGTIIQSKNLYVGDGNETFFLNDRYEAFTLSGDGMGKIHRFNDGFEKEETSIENGAVIRRESGYIKNIRWEGIVYFADNVIRELAICDGISPIDGNPIHSIGLLQEHYKDIDNQLKYDMDKVPFYFPNLNVNNVFDEDFGYALAFEERNLIKCNLADLIIRREYKNKEVLIESNLNFAKWYLLPETDCWIVMAGRQKNALEEGKTYFIYPNDGQIEIVEDETEVVTPEPTTYVLTPINKD